jgi:hypothetical protein
MSTLERNDPSNAEHCYEAPAVHVMIRACFARFKSLVVKLSAENLDWENPNILAGNNLDFSGLLYQGLGEVGILTQSYGYDLSPFASAGTKVNSHLV